MYLEKLTRGQGEAFTRQSKLNAFFGEKPVTGPILDQLHPVELIIGFWVFWFTDFDETWPRQSQNINFFENFWKCLKKDVSMSERFRIFYEGADLPDIEYDELLESLIYKFQNLYRK